ncbi:MAG: ABC transporter ATP-binding protein [Christensenellales bacterium]|jgi:putative ABC transport system ATP-binding protein
MSIVETMDLCKQYGRGDTAVHALRNVNLRVEKGEFVALLGASGSGKSTLLHMLGAVDHPTSGRVLVDGMEITGRAERDLAVFRRRKIGFVFQFYNLIPVLSAEENILLPVNLDGQSVDKAYFEDLLATFRIADKRKALPNQLSGGQQQRVAVARALVHRPAVILADEPTGNLDTRNSREMIALMKSSVRRYGQTLLLITHDPQVADQADRVLRMVDGCLAEGAEG